MGGWVRCVCVCVCVYVSGVTKWLGGGVAGDANLLVVRFFTKICLPARLLRGTARAIARTARTTSFSISGASSVQPTR